MTQSESTDVIQRIHDSLMALYPNGQYYRGLTEDTLTLSFAINRQKPDLLLRQTNLTNISVNIEGHAEIQQVLKNLSIEHQLHTSPNNVDACSVERRGFTISIADPSTLPKLQKMADLLEQAATNFVTASRRNQNPSESLAIIRALHASQRLKNSA